ITFSENWIGELAKTLPELPFDRYVRFCKNYGLSETEAAELTQERDFADYFEAVAKESKNPKASASWIMSELLRELNEENLPISQSKVTPAHLAQLIQLI